MSIAVQAALTGRTIIWGAPTYDQVRIGWYETMRALGPVAFQIKKEFTIAIPGAGRIIYRTLNDPGTKRGFTADGVVLDECGELDREVYYEVVRPFVMDTGGWIWGIGTPKGLSWFYDQFMVGMRGEDSQVMSFQAPTVGCRIEPDGTLVRVPHPLENPYINFYEIQSIYRDVDEHAFRQEILAEFLEDGAGVFSNVMSSAIAPMDVAPDQGRHYVMGIDLGRSNDFTVMTVIDIESRTQVDFSRLSQYSYVVQKTEALRLYQKWRPISVVVEKNSVGDPFIDYLQLAGVPVMPFMTTTASKPNLIGSLALAFDQRVISILNIQQQVDELRGYQAIRLPSGMVRYEAPSGRHDDCVMALALAWFGAQELSASPLLRADLLLPIGATPHRDPLKIYSFVFVGTESGAGATIYVDGDDSVVLDVRPLFYDQRSLTLYLASYGAMNVGCDREFESMLYPSWVEYIDSAYRNADIHKTPFFSTLRRDKDEVRRQLGYIHGGIAAGKMKIEQKVRDDSFAWRELNTQGSACLDALAGAYELASKMKRTY